MARRLSRPFRELAGTARELGAGRFDIAETQYRLPEAQAIATALSSSASQLEELLDRERQFAANASHQLRTPITALRLELEDLTYWPETAPEVAQGLHHALGELDRLSAAVTELLDLARGRRLGEPVGVNLAELLEAAATRWARHAEDLGRSIEVRVPADLVGVVREGPVGQILDVLIENALSHGRGDVTLRAADAASHLRIEVQDQGARPQRADLFERRVSHGGGEGIGLAVAAELATAAGGSLRLDADPRTSFVLLLSQQPEGDPAAAGIPARAE
nr:HAMP domain-containing sensor histidine kinase [Nesterenkonia sp. Act20]